MGWRTWVAGETVPAATLQSYLQDQANLIFADASARDAAIPSGSRVAGMIAYTANDDTHWVWTGSTWRSLNEPELRVTATTGFSTSSTTLVNTPLAVPLPANSTWAVSIMLIMAQGTNRKWAITGPSGATGALAAAPDRPAGGSVSGASRVVDLGQAIDLDCTFNGAGTRGLYELVGWVALGATAGNLTLQCALVTADTAAGYDARSTLTVRRLA